MIIERARNRLEDKTIDGISVLDAFAARKSANEASSA